MELSFAPELKLVFCCQVEHRVFACLNFYRLPPFLVISWGGGDGFKFVGRRGSVPSQPRLCLNTVVYLAVCLTSHLFRIIEQTFAVIRSVCS